MPKQQEQLAQQQQEIDRLRSNSQRRLRRSCNGPASRRDVQQAKLAAQDAPRVTLNNARPTITSADGRSSIAIRSVVQLDAAHYGEDADGARPPTFAAARWAQRANRENAAARDFSRRRLLPSRALRLRRHDRPRLQLSAAAELGGSGTEGPARINDPGSATPALRRSRFQVGAFSPPANMDDSISPESCSSSSAPAARSCRARSAAPTAASVSACKATARAG